VRWLRDPGESRPTSRNGPPVFGPEYSKSGPNWQWPSLVAAKPCRANTISGLVEFVNEEFRFGHDGPSSIAVQPDSRHHRRVTDISLQARRTEQAMHGEYKTPGGKLVVVDLEVNQGRLHNVEVSGDFFLYPEETLTAIVSALEGLPAKLSEPEIASAIDRATPPGAEMLGTSPEAIAIAVQRALRDGAEGPAKT